MTVAIPHWQNRVSPVFDVAHNLLVVEVRDGRAVSRRDVMLTAQDPRRRASQVAATGATVLICGAISWPLELSVEATGVEVISQICGDTEQVLAAHIDGQLDQGDFLMPGCCGRRQRAHGRHGRGPNR